MPPNTSCLIYFDININKGNDEYKEDYKDEDNEIKIDNKDK